MPVQHINRRSQVYYLYQGTTKTGKPKYFFSMKIKENRLDALPDGFEIYENPNAQVFLIKKEPPLITDIERQAVISAIKKNKSVEYFIVDVRKKHITIYTAQQNVTFFHEDPWLSKLRQQGNIQMLLTYMGEIRFELVDKNQRYFIAERFCYSGSVDNWVLISTPDRLPRRYPKLTHPFYLKLIRSEVEDFVMKNMEKITSRQKHLKKRTKRSYLRIECGLT